MRDLYSIKPVSASRRIVLIRQISEDLSAWRAELSRFLDADYFSTSLLIPIYQRQRNVLNLTYWHSIILTHRSYILRDLTPYPLHARGAGNGDRQTEESVQQCLMAAIKIVNTIDDLTLNRQMYRAFWVCAS